MRRSCIFTATAAAKPACATLSFSSAPPKNLFMVGSLRTSSRPSLTAGAIWPKDSGGSMLLLILPYSYVIETVDALATYTNRRTGAYHQKAAQWMAGSGITHTKCFVTESLGDRPGSQAGESRIR